jgi:homoserine dehydrogenase
MAAVDRRVVRANPNTLHREPQGEGVLLQLDTGEYFGLDEVHQRGSDAVPLMLRRGHDPVDVERAKALVDADCVVVSDARAVIANPDIDIVVELIGGYGIALELVMLAIESGKHVVTAMVLLLSFCSSVPANWWIYTS